MVYLNGNYVEPDQAMVSVNDRGFLFADGVYEVIRIYNGKPFLMGAHMQRLRNGLTALRLPTDVARTLPVIIMQLQKENGLSQSDAVVYLQITRGSAPRKHAFPPVDTPPTVYVNVYAYNPFPAEYFSAGVATITLPDTRWSRCDVKSVSLLPNVLANQAAHEQDAFEALLVRDGVVIEGSHSNLFGVSDGTLITYPACNYILNGITREAVLQLARELHIPVREGAIHAHQIAGIDELFLTGTTTEVMPVTRVDGREVADGAPGPLTRRLMQVFAERATAA